MHSVILCGGSGTRLWPLSRKNYPKQFLKLFGERSLIQETFWRMSQIMPEDNIFFITNKDNYFNVYNQIRETFPNFRRDRIIAEPMAKNTAPAMVLAMKALADKFNVAQNEPVIFLPSDHYIQKTEVYLSLIKTAMEELGDNIGTIGITPTRPHIGYGYIKKDKKSGSYYTVSEFKEKPDLETAKKYVDSGEYVWNGGMFLFNPKTFFEELRVCAPDLYEPASEKLEDFIEKFESLPSISIDYAIAEKSKRVIVFEGEFGWNDIGSFDSMAEIFKSDPNPKHLSFEAKDNYIHTENGRLVCTMGVEGLVVVEASDSILIYKKGRGEDVKKIVEYLKENKIKELEHNVMGYRPWGKYEVLVDHPNHKVKKITVYPEAKLSLQSHKFRAEHWVVVKGTALVVNGEKEITLQENESTYIPYETKHRLSNPTKENLEIIEVQTGTYLEEDDITRYEDVYERMEDKVVAKA